MTRPFLCFNSNEIWPFPTIGWIFAYQNPCEFFVSFFVYINLGLCIYPVSVSLNSQQTTYPSVYSLILLLCQFTSFFYYIFCFVLFLFPRYHILAILLSIIYFNLYIACSYGLILATINNDCVSHLKFPLHCHVQVILCTISLVYFLKWPYYFFRSHLNWLCLKRNEQKKLM